MNRIARRTGSRQRRRVQLGSSAVLTASQIRVTRGGRRVLDGVDLAITPGETIAIQGPSGCGKSTLVRVLATLIEPDGGEVQLEGRDARAIAPREYRRRVTYLAQAPAMFPGTVAENISFGPAQRGETLPADRVVEALTQAGLPAEYATREATTLSGGERQRVALARALANDPDVLLLDEPTAALDPASAGKVLALLRTLTGAGRAVVMVTHVAEHALALGGTRYLCDRGRLERQP
jgi:putative ABC transport system ATP-binding protein